MALDSAMRGTLIKFIFYGSLTVSSPVSGWRWLFVCVSRLDGASVTRPSHVPRPPRFVPPVTVRMSVHQRVSPILPGLAGLEEITVDR